MSWEFPKRLPRPTSVINPEDHNETLRPFENRLGSLNEHNFDTAMKTQLVRKTDLAEDVAMSVAFSYKAGEAKKLLTYEPGEIDSGGIIRGVSRVVRHLDGWQTIPDAQVDFVTGGGNFFVWAGGGFAMAGEDNSFAIGTARLTIMVDGTPYPELTVGALDDSEQGLHMERGIAGFRGGYSIQGVIPLAAGHHVLQLAVDIDDYPGRTSIAPYVGFSSAPILVVELSR